MKKYIIIISSMFVAMLVGFVAVQQPVQFVNQAQEPSQSGSTIGDQVIACNVLWECAIPPELHQKFIDDGIDYRLIVHFQDSTRTDRGALNTPSVKFRPDNKQNFTCNLEIVGSSGELKVCDYYSGRQVCVPGGPTGVIGRTIIQTTPVPTFSVQRQCVPHNRDFNNDGVVYIFDAGIFIQRYLTNNSDADLNCDGSIDRLDWDIMRGSSFGR